MVAKCPSSRCNLSDYYRGENTGQNDLGEKRTIRGGGRQTGMRSGHGER